MIATIIITSLAYLWLMYETDWLRVRLPVGSTTWHDELPYAIGYLDCEFEDDWEDDINDDPLDSDIESLNQTKWHHTEAQYQQWLKKRHEPKLKYGFVDHTVDYPQDQALAEIEDLDKRRAGEMIYQR